MISPIASIAWKEWREHRWMLAALLIIVLGTHAWVLCYERTGPASYSIAMWMTFLLVMPLGSAFIAMNAAAGERSRKTLPLLQGLPVSLKYTAATKLIFSIATVWLTQLAAILFTYALVMLGEWSGWSGHSSALHALESFPVLFLTGHWTFDLLITSALVVTSIVLWIAATGVNSESEVRAGAIGLGVITAIWAGFTSFVYLSSIFVTEAPTVPELRGLLAALPGGVIGAMRHPDDPRHIIPIAILLPYLATHVPLAWWYITRFGQTEQANKWSPSDATSLAVRGEWLDSPHESPLKALLWKQSRQCGPVIATSFACAILVMVVFTSIMWFDQNYALDESYRSFYRDIGIQVVGVFTFFGCLAGLVAGVGQSTADLDSRLFEFWRSRPINIDLWFGTMFGAGIVMLLVVFGIPVLVGLLIFIQFQTLEDTGAAIITLPALLLAYTSGVLSGCMIRHAIYASLIGFIITLFVIATASALSDWLLFVSSLENIMLGAILIFFTSAMAIAAWTAVRKNWFIPLA